MKVLWIICCAILIFDGFYLLTKLRRLTELLEDIRKDTRELIVRARKEEDGNREL